MFRSQTDVFDPFNIFSKYTPLKNNVTEKKNALVSINIKKKINKTRHTVFNKHVLADAHVK